MNDKQESRVNTPPDSLSLITPNHALLLAAHLAGCSSCRDVIAYWLLDTQNQPAPRCTNISPVVERSTLGNELKLDLGDFKLGAFPGLRITITTPTSKKENI